MNNNIQQLEEINKICNDVLEIGNNHIFPDSLYLSFLTIYLKDDYPSYIKSVLETLFAENIKTLKRYNILTFLQTVCNKIKEHNNLIIRPWEKHNHHTIIFNHNRRFASYPTKDIEHTLMHIWLRGADNLEQNKQLTLSFTKMHDIQEQKKLLNTLQTSIDTTSSYINKLNWVLKKVEKLDF